MLTLLLMGMLTLAFNIQPVNAFENIYIRPDGSIDPPTAPITRDGDVYTFTDNIHDPVEVERNSIVVDGAGYMIQERPGVHRAVIGGINLFGRSDVTIKNVEIKGFETGIYLEGSSNNRLFGNNAINNTAFGIRLGGTNNILRNNTMIGNDYNFDAEWGRVNDVDASNTVDGKPIYYWIDKQDMTVPLDAGCVVLINCARITVRNLNLTKNAAGVLLTSTENSIITRNRMASNFRGIYFDYSSNNIISANDLTNNNFGIFLWNSEHNSLIGNNIANNSLGIDLSGTSHWGGSSNNILYHNNFINNTQQVDLFDSFDNAWDNDYPSGGNYWSDYTGEDANGDGIGDTPYVIDEDNTDRYPLMNPWAPPEHELVTLISAPLSLWLGASSSLDAIVINDGLNDEVNVELWLLINGTVMNSTTIPLLQAGNLYTLRYLWAPTVEATYNVTAYAHPVPGESYVENNQMSTFVTVTAPPLELVVSIMPPTSLRLGSSLLLDANVTNVGLNDKTDVELWLLINGNIVNSTTISLLQAGDTYTLSYLWTPTVKGIYNVTAYASPVLGESYNQMTKFVTVVQVGVKAGDWIKYDYTVTGAPSGTVLPTWMRVEFLSVEGITVTVRLTMHLSNGTEGSETLTLDVARTLPYDTGGTFDTFFGFGFVIPANSTVGVDYIYIMLLSPEFMLGKKIDGETTRTYAGASRTAVYATFSYIGARYGNKPLKYYWDKQTGVMLEASATLDGMTATAKATETNMWEAVPEEISEEEVPFWTQWWFWTIVIAGIIALAGAVYFLKKRKPPTPTAPTLPTEGTL